MLAATTVLVMLLAAMCGGVLLAGRPTSRRWSRGLAGVLVLLAGAWLGVDGPLEGSVVWQLTPQHGLTAADLLVIPALAVAGLLALGVPSRRRVSSSHGRKNHSPD